MEVYFKMCFVIATGIIGFSYKYYALPKGWPIGTMWLNDFGMPNKHGFFMTVLGFGLSFFLMKWYFVFAVLAVAYFLLL
ncbi:MAG TPA: hypothetical protein VFC67_26705 [Prolixibacteraceae bacterium]|nr:hypothetical protein [Prolixibacteraceae bacterium]